MNKIQHKLKTEYSTVYLYHRVLTNWCNICPSTTWQRCLFIVHGWCSFCLAFLFQLLQQSTKAGSIVVSSKNCFKCNYAELTDVSEVERLRCNAETRSFYIICCDHRHSSTFQLTNYLASISLLRASVNIVIYVKFFTLPETKSKSS